MDKYEKLLKKFKKTIISEDTELAHILRDKIFIKFIKDVSNNKLSSSEIKIISNKLKLELIKSGFEFWYT